MRAIEKINLKKYLVLVSVTTAIALAFSRSYLDVLGVFAVFLGTLGNHYMLVEGVFSVIDMGQGRKVDKTQLLVIFVGKFGVLFGAIYLGWHFMGDRVIIPVLNYVVQIFILVFSFKKES